MSESAFAELIARIRRGDQQAAVDLVRLYEPVIRRAIRFRLSSAGLRSTLDSMDICQSVLGNFFVRAASGQYQLDQPSGHGRPRPKDRTVHRRGPKHPRARL